MSSFAAPDHVGAVVATVLLSVALCVGARLRPGMTAAARVLGAVLIANEVFYVALLVVRGSWTAQYDLPLYLCDVGAVIAGVALWWPRPLLVEVTYFWALAGTLQGILTPDAYYAFPSYQYWEFYIGHVGVVVAAFVLVVGQRRHPRRGATVRVFAITVAFTAVVGVVDALVNANYMYLRHVPGAGSLLSFMGPWPWYILTGALLAGLLLMGLDLPFRGARRRMSASGGRAAAR